MVVDSRTFLDDPSSLKALIEMMPEAERAVYKSYGALSLESAFPGRKMIVYTLRGGKPTGIEVLSFGQLTCDWETGPAFEVMDERGKMEVTCVPRRYRPRDLFLHVPQQFTLKYKGRQATKTSVDFVSHYAVLVKTRSKEIHQVDGDTYCVTLNKFRERFPDLKIRY